MQQLTKGELKIIRALEKVAKMWRDHGSELILFNGQSLRKGGADISKEIAFFPDIKGDGGDGGDKF